MWERERESVRGNPLRSLTLVSAINPALFLLKKTKVTVRHGTSSWDTTNHFKHFHLCFSFPFIIIIIIIDRWPHNRIAILSPSLKHMLLSLIWLGLCLCPYPMLPSHSLCGRVPPVSACHALPGTCQRQTLRPWQLSFAATAAMPAPFSLLLLISEIRWKLIDCVYDSLRLKRES